MRLPIHSLVPLPPYSPLAWCYSYTCTYCSHTDKYWQIAIRWCCARYSLHIMHKFKHLTYTYMHIHANRWNIPTVLCAGMLSLLCAAWRIWGIWSVWYQYCMYVQVSSARKVAIRIDTNTQWQSLQIFITYLQDTDNIQTTYMQHKCKFIRGKHKYLYVFAM